MTRLNHPSGLDEAPHVRLRLATLLYAVLLGLQCMWLVAAELVRPGIEKLPTDLTSAIAAGKQRAAASLAASIGGIRGDLWAESAFTYANLLWTEGGAGTNSSVTETLDSAAENLRRTLAYSPSQSGAWLLRTGLALHFPSLAIDPTESLKMSYYTGSSEPHLIPFRLIIAVYTNHFDDIELREFIGRDVRLLMAWNQKSTIAEAEKAATPTGRNFIEQTVKDLDSSSPRTGAQLHPLPD